MTGFPRTNVGGVSVSKMIIGCNWITGYSHRGPASDHMIAEANKNIEHATGIFTAFLKHDVDTVLGLFGEDKGLEKAVKLAEDRTGKKMIIMDEPILNMENTPMARHEAELAIKACAERGATFCLPLHSCAEQLVNKNTQTLDRLPDYLSMIRDAGLIPGLSSHMPEVIQYTDKNNYDVETYIQIYNCMGFLMQVEIESIAKIIQNAKKPVLTIKPCAAGRTTPFVGLNFVLNTIRQQDMVCIGCHTPEEVEEDVEYALAAMERRAPRIASRCSPLQTDVVSGVIQSQK